MIGALHGTRPLRRAVTRLALLIALMLAATACGGESRSFGVTIGAALSDGSPLRIADVGDTRVERGGSAEHSLVFESTQAVVLDDIRWTFSAVRGRAVFATAGHGCGPSIDTESGAIQFACTEDYRYLVVEPGKPLTETITLYGGIEGRPVATGRFTFRQPITWWHFTGDPLEPRGDKGGEIVVTLTYNVRST